MSKTSSGVNSSIPSPDPYDLPLHIHSIHIVGNNRTASSFIEDEFIQAKQATTVKQVLQSLDKALAALESYGIFSKAVFELDAAEPSSTPTTDTSSPIPLSTSVTVRVEEKYWLAGKTEITQEIHSGEQISSTSGMIRNVFGHGERLEANFQTGTENSGAFALSLSKPKLFNQHSIRGQAGIFTHVANCSRMSSFREVSRGFRASISDVLGRHDIAYEGVWREVFPTYRVLTEDEKRVGFYQGASASVVQSSVPSTKSSIRYTYTRDQLDNRFVPTKGTFTQASTEIAGLGGDTHFAKMQIDSKYYYPLHPYITLGVCCMGGIIHPLSRLTSAAPAVSSSVSSSPSSISSSSLPHYLSPSAAFLSRTRISDRFFFGGPLTMRGVEHAGLGPLDHEDALGGEIMTSLGCNANFALPVEALRESGVRGQVFINAANLVAFDDHSYQQTMKEMLVSSRLSVGVGIAIPTPIGRLEFNVLQPVRKQSTDRTHRYQWGLALQFI